MAGMKKILPPKKKASSKQPEPYVEEHRPSITFYESQLPELKSMAMGDKTVLCVEVELRSLSTQEYGQYKGEVCGSFYVNKVGVDNDSDEDDKS